RVEMDVGNPIRTRHELRDVARADRAVGAEVGADVDVDAAAQPEQRAVAAAGNLDVAIHLAGMRHGEEVLAPVLDPFDRTAKEFGSERNEEILGEELAARTEAAIYIVLDKVDAAAGRT